MTGSGKPRRALLVWETGGGGSHNTRILHLAAALKRRGLLVDFASVRPHEIEGPIDSIDRLIQAPVLPRMSRTAGGPSTKPVRSYADILRYFEVHRPIVVRRQLETWRTIFETARPDLVITDYSPVAVLAARGKFPTAAFGCGFTAPCGANGRFPPFPPHQSSDVQDEIELLVATNAALGELGEPTVADLPSAFVPPQNFAYGFSEIDPYATSRTDELLSPVVERCSIEPGTGRDIVAFLPKSLKNDAGIVQALISLDLPIRLHGRDLEPDVRRTLEQSGACVEAGSIDSDSIAKHGAIALSHGGFHSVVRALVAGVPQVIVGNTPEHWFFDHVLRQLGIGIGVGRRDEIRGAVEHVIFDRSYAERARALAPDFRRRHVDDTFEIVADRIAAVR